MAVKKMPIFFYRMHTPPREYTAAGSPLIPTYTEEVDKDTGHKRLVCSGETNIYNRIQASLEQSKLENILRRAQMGDDTALNAAQAQFLDVTGMPSSFGEMQNIICKAKSNFEQLPLSVREQFGFSAERYVAMIGTDEWAEIIGIKQPEPAPEPDKEVTTSEP